jgi:hypothetical protein
LDIEIHIRKNDKPDKNYRRGLRKRCKYFCIQGGCLYYVGGKVKIPRLVIEACEEYS